MIEGLVSLLILFIPLFAALAVGLVIARLLGFTDYED